GSVDAGPRPVHGRRVAAVGRAHHAVVAAGRCPGNAVTGGEDTGLEAVAELAVVADPGHAHAAPVAAGVVQGAGIVVVALRTVRLRRVRARPVGRVAGPRLVALVGGRAADCDGPRAGHGLTAE